MSKLNDERWAFKVEHYDPAADLVRQYELLYYLGDSTLEMVRISSQTAGAAFSPLLLVHPRRRAP